MASLTPKNLAYNSAIATDPLRSFRFYAEFTPANGVNTFSTKLKDSATGSYSTTGQSDGWVGGFSSVTGLNIATQPIAYREGGYNTTVHQIPGMTTFQPVTFTRGVIYGNDQAIAWMRGLFAAASGAGLNPATAGGATNFRVDVTIYVQDHPNTSPDPKDSPTKVAFKIHNAWISNLNFSDLDATNNQILFETMQLTHEGLSVFYTNSSGKSVDGLVY